MVTWTFGPMVAQYIKSSVHGRGKCSAHGNRKVGREEEERSGSQSSSPGHIPSAPHLTPFY
jgi:hypothetical protein